LGTGSPALPFPIEEAGSGKGNASLQRIFDIDTFVRPRQKHKQHSSTIYKKYEKKKDKN